MRTLKVAGKSFGHFVGRRTRGKRRGDSSFKE